MLYELLLEPLMDDTIPGVTAAPLNDDEIALGVVLQACEREREELTGRWMNWQSAHNSRAWHVGLSARLLWLYGNGDRRISTTMARSVSI